MARLKDYERRYDFLREPAKAATESYETAARFFDQLKELILIEKGLVHTSDFFHKTAHWFPGQFDILGDILHQHHVIQVYGATREFPGVSDDLSDMIALAVELLDNIVDRLAEMIGVCEAEKCWAVARQLETLQINVSEKRAQYLLIWKMYEESDSASSFDSWVARLLDEEGDEQ